MPFPSDDLEKCARAIDPGGFRGNAAGGLCVCVACETRQVKAREQAQAALTALTECGWGKVPDGWKLVPIEPSEEMVRRGRNESCDAEDDEIGPIYRAMLKASPTPPQQREPG